MALACKICIATKGLSGSDLAALPQTEEELFVHLEKEHHIVVTREGESIEAATERFLSTYPEARTCEDCRQRGAPWMQA